MSNKVMPMNVDTSVNNTVDQSRGNYGMRIDQEDDQFAVAFRMAAEQEHRQTLVRAGTQFLDGPGDNVIKHEVSVDIESEHEEQVGESGAIRQPT